MCFYTACGWFVCLEMHVSFFKDCFGDLFTLVETEFCVGRSQLTDGLKCCHSNRIYDII